MNQNWNNHNHQSGNRKRSQRANENSKWEQANFLTSERPRLDSSSSAESNGMRGVSFLSQLHYQGKQIKAKQGVSRFCSRAFDSSLAWVRVCTLDWKYKKPTLVLRPLADMFFALFSAFAMTALKLYRVCVRELACNMHFFLLVYTGCSAGIICSQFAMW